MPEPIFVVGVPRSGTTLLAAFLGAHSQMCCGPETHLFWAWRHRKSTLRILHKRNWPQAGVDFFNSISQHGQSVPENYGITAEELEAELKQRRPSVASLLSALMEINMRRSGKSRWVEKTPQHYLVVEEIRKHFPLSPIIRIVRDPRDVALSLAKLDWGPSNITAGLQLWRRYENVGHHFFESDPLAITITYESLVEDPADTLKCLCDHIGETFETQMLDTTNATDNVNKTNEPWKYKVSTPPDKTRIYCWRNEMTNEDRLIADTLVGDKLLQYGYERGPEPLNYVQFLHDGVIATRPSVADALLKTNCRTWPRSPLEKPIAIISTEDEYPAMGLSRLSKVACMLTLCTAYCSSRLSGIYTIYIKRSECKARCRKGLRVKCLNLFTKIMSRQITDCSVLPNSIAINTRALPPDVSLKQTLKIPNDT